MNFTKKGLFRNINVFFEQISLSIVSVWTNGVEKFNYMVSANHFFYLDRKLSRESYLVTFALRLSLFPYISGSSLEYFSLIFLLSD